MSFSGEVKAELLSVISPDRAGRLAEAAAIFRSEGESAPGTSGKPCISLRSGGTEAVRKGFTLLQKAGIIKKVTAARLSEALSGGLRRIGPENLAEWAAVREALWTSGSGLPEDGGRPPGTEDARRAFLRGCFLCIGSMSDPGREYHLEFVCAEERQAEELTGLLARESLHAKTVLRRSSQVVYLKESEAIADLLTMMGAHRSVMAMENLKIRKEIANQINRQVNCETSNLMKTVAASGRQITDIRYLKEHGGFGSLPEVLRQTAENRLRYPDATLLELGNMAVPPVGKSGVNHRLRKLSETAQELRRQSESL
ncbi:DNA-binding protein WhiA [Lachnoclostridium sp. Marseille-P6806]|uniref:DNA-binding protein WhiA n=1 Tax=Lachnoclostridium sp. Marseille-P6806 TaxID=2364793 RepID=UPI00102F6AA7|nr:DNA-binding protein WhiA [Lachnoclostridium sp. Marseille-P6806]